MFAKRIRDGEYMTMLDPFQIKYGNALTAIQSLASLIVDTTWFPSTLMGLGTENTFHDTDCNKCIHFTLQC